MKVTIRLIRDLILGQAALTLMALFFAIPVILYVFIFSKFTPDWAGGIVIIALIVGFTVTLENFQNDKILSKNQSMEKHNIEKFTTLEINESKAKAHSWAEAKYKELESLKHSIHKHDYENKKQKIKFKLDERIVLLNNALEARNKIGFFHYALIAAGLLILWLQPWESPVEKISDEWKNCNSKYNKQCAYVGKKFKTNSFEMLISEAIHGEYGDNECSRSSHWEDC